MKTLSHSTHALTSRTSSRLGRRLALASVALACGMSPSLASAATNWTVCASGCDATTVQAAVDAASNDDVIVVHDDVTESISVTDKTLTIRWHWGERRTIDAGGADHALYVSDTASVKVIGLDLTGATVAGIYNDGGTVRLDGAHVYGNVAPYGGILSTGLLVMRGGVLIANNESTSFFAGGINNVAGVIQTWGTGVTFMGNVGYNGGALGNYSGIARIRSCSFTGNDAYLGGAIHNSSGQLHLIGSSFSDNHATSLGGAWSNHNVEGTVSEDGVGYAGNSSGSGTFEDCYDVNGTCGS